MLMLLYFLITKLYCALIALWKPRQISSQMKQYNADMIHCQYMLSKGKQQWSHINILKDSSKQFSLWNSIFYISHFQTNIFIKFAVLVQCTQVNKMLVWCHSECISTPGRLEKYAWPRWDPTVSQAVHIGFIDLRCTAIHFSGLK
jgi:hypothetical protein